MYVECDNWAVTETLNLQEDIKHTYFNPRKEGETKEVSVSPEFNDK
jgi:hypothetical protein